MMLYIGSVTITLLIYYAFFSDGVVVSATIPTAFIDYMKKPVLELLNHNCEISGKYNVTGNNIHFIIHGKGGDIEYSGIIVSEEILLFDVHMDGSNRYDELYSLKKY